MEGFWMTVCHIGNYHTRMIVHRGDFRICQRDSFRQSTLSQFANLVTSTLRTYREHAPGTNGDDSCFSFQPYQPKKCSAHKVASFDVDFLDSIKEPVSHMFPPIPESQDEGILQNLPTIPSARSLQSSPWTTRDRHH